MRIARHRLNSHTTIKQVAKEAQVSIQTVSRVINDRPDVSEETRDRVLEVIARLDYRPNAIARGLVSRRSQTLGVVGTAPEFYGPSRTVVGIERQANALGYSVLLSIVHEPSTEEIDPILTNLLSRQVEGIVWAVPEIGNNRSWVQHQVPQIAVPIVFLTMQPRSELSVVALDNRAGGRLATEHLVEQGYRQIGLITGPLDWWEARERKLGWEDALSTAGIQYDDRQIFEGDWGAASGEQAFIKLCERFPEMDALFASNDQMAQGVLHGAWISGLRVPDDLAIVGFDDIPEASYFIPPLTTVRQPSEEIGRSAVRVLNGLVDARHRTGSLTPAEPYSLEPELVIRSSSSRVITLEHNPVNVDTGRQAPTN